MIKSCFIKKDKRTELEKAIDRTLEEMRYVLPGSEEYTAMTKNLEILYKTKTVSKEKSKMSEAWIVGGLGLVQLLCVLYFEKTDIIRSKAMSFILKGRV
jgi:hypothetical protein